MGDGSSTMNSMTSSYLSVAARSIRSEVAIGSGSEENSPNLSSTSSAAASDASSTVSNHSLSSSVEGGTPNNKDGDRDEKEGSITPVGADLSELHTHKLSAG